MERIPSQSTQLAEFVDSEACRGSTNAFVGLCVCVCAWVACKCTHGSIPLRVEPFAMQ